MRLLVGTVGLCLICGAALTLLVGVKAGLCGAMIVAGVGLTVDAIRK